MNASQPSVSVVIATYNRGDLLADTIEFVLANNYSGLELVVVDQTQAYSPGVETRLRDLQQSGAYEHLKIPIANLPLARNVGLQHTAGDIVIFCDDDVVFDEDFVACHVRPYQQASDVGAVGGRVITPGDERDPDVPSGPPGRIDENMGTHFRFYQQSVPCEIDFGMGCNMSFRREALEAAGGFDERYAGAAFYEEVDAFARVRREGYRAMFEPAAKLTHLKSPDGGCRSQEEFRQRRSSVIRSRALFQSGYLQPHSVSSFARLLKRGLQSSLFAADEYQRTHGPHGDRYERLSRPLRRILSSPQVAYFFRAYLEGLRARYRGDSHYLTAGLDAHAVKPRFQAAAQAPA